MEIKGLQNLWTTALKKWALKNGTSRSCFMSLGLKNWRIILMFEPIPCSTQLSVQISFATRSARHCQLCTSNALASCTNESDPLWTEKEGKRPSLVCSEQGGTASSKLAHLKFALLYVLFGFGIPFWLKESAVISWPTFPWSFSLG